MGSLIFLVALVSFNDTPNIPEYLQDISCTIKAQKGTGSGTFIKEDFVITAAHVVSDSFKAKENVKVIMLKRNKNREEIGSKIYDAKIIAYSNSRRGEDIAILQIIRKNTFSKNAVFTKESDLLFPGVGTEVWHCGSLLGKYRQSIVKGRISAIGRRIRNEKVFDQLDIGAYSGSSGGGVFDEKGHYIGMLTTGVERGGNLHCFIPTRRIQVWLKKRKLDFLLNHSPETPLLAR